MIRPVNTLSSGRVFYGDTASKQAKRDADIKKNKTKSAIINAGSLSVGLGVVTAAIARSNTTSWHNAMIYGIGATAVAMMFLVPGFLYKAGIATNGKTEKDIFVKEKDKSKKMLASGDSVIIKTASKTAVKSLAKV